MEGLPEVVRNKARALGVERLPLLETGRSLAAVRKPLADAIRGVPEEIARKHRTGSL